jgi:hypothetical protein
VKRLILTAACAALLVGCAPQKPAASAGKPNTDALPMAEFMGHVVDPAAFAYWRGSGTEITADGEKDLSPTTEEGWVQVENGAAILIEAGNLLQMEGRRRAPEADWNRYAQQLTERAIAAKAAAEKHDKQGVFDEGGRVYEVCTACHKQFIIDPELAANGPAKGDPLPELPAAKKR